MNYRESSQFTYDITTDGTQAGLVIGQVSATLNTGEKTLNFTQQMYNVTLPSGTSMPSDADIAKQIVDFENLIRQKATDGGLGAFGVVAS